VKQAKPQEWSPAIYAEILKNYSTGLFESQQNNPTGRDKADFFAHPRYI
jgi:hypothetical protein